MHTFIPEAIFRVFMAIPRCANILFCVAEKMRHSWRLVRSPEYPWSWRPNYQMNPNIPDDVQ
jgi:hypothetical protein